MTITYLPLTKGACRFPSHLQQNVRYPQEFIFVTYSAEYGTIKTGFQASGPGTIFTDGFEQLIRHRDETLFWL